MVVPSFLLFHLAAVLFFLLPPLYRDARRFNAHSVDGMEQYRSKKLTYYDTLKTNVDSFRF